jgi:hypothetical protein
LSLCGKIDFVWRKIVGKIGQARVAAPHALHLVPLQGNSRQYNSDMKRRQFHQIPLASAAALWVAAMPTTLRAQSTAPAPALNVALEDASAEFLKFYDAANKPELALDAKTALWKSQYNLKDLPQDDAAFAKAWPQYAEAMARIKPGFDGVKPSPVQMLGKMAGVLRYSEPTKLTFLAYVGTYDQPVRLLQRGTEQVLALPLELPTATLVSQAAHALGNMLAAKVEVNPSAAQTVADRVVREGVIFNAIRLALDTTSDALVWEAIPGYLSQVQGKLPELARAVKPLLADAKPETQARLTTGTGTSGLPREAQYLCYMVVKTWLNRGLTFSEIIRTPRAEFVRNVGATLDVLAKR